MKCQSLIAPLRVIRANRLLYYKLGFRRMVLAAGMPRSGSTLLFNIIRLVLSSDPSCKLSSGWIGELRKLPKGKSYLIKTHTLDKARTFRAFRTFYSYRDIRDALVSLSRSFQATLSSEAERGFFSQWKNGMPPSLETARNWIAQFECAEKNASLMLRYEDMIKDIPATISKVADTLNQRVVVEEVMRGLPSGREEDNSENAYSETTLLHRGHVTGTVSGEWRTFLDQDLLRQLDSEFGWWFGQNGYEMAYS